MKTQAKSPVKTTAKTKSENPPHRPSKYQSNINPSAKYQAPKGFDVVSTGGNGVMIDWDTQPVIECVVVSIAEVNLKPKKKGEKPTKTRILTLATDAGHIGVWEKHQLKILFDTAPVGAHVWIAHTGTKKIPGRPLPMHEFSVAMK